MKIIIKMALYSRSSVQNVNRLEVLDQKKANGLLNSIKEQDSDNLIDKMYLCAGDLNKP